MKKLLLVLLFAFMASSIHAQYRRYKKLYDVKEYTSLPGDRYDLGSVTLISTLFPGLGHVVLNDPWRGLGFYAISHGSFVITMLGLSKFNGISDETTANVLFFGGAALWVGSHIWCISDARRMAKIKNMHLREQNLSLRLYPSLQSYASKNTLGSSIPGATLTINF